VKQLFWSLAIVGLTPTIAVAVESTENTPTLEIFYGERTEVAVKGILRAVTADPTLLELELSNGQLFITARKSGQTLLYLWNEQGLQVYMIKSKAARRISTQDRPQRVALQRSQTGISGSYGSNVNALFGVSQQRLFLGQNLNLEYPLEAQQRLFSRINQVAQLAFNPSANQVSIPFIQAAYQSPSWLVNLGNMAVQQPVQIASGFGSNLRGGSISLTQALSRYDAFVGQIALPLVVWSDQNAFPSGEKPLLAGGSGSWRFPLRLFEQGGTLDVQGLVASQITPDIQPTLAAGMTWNHPQTRLQLALGSRLNAAGIFAQAFYNHAWPDIQTSFNITGQYRHFGMGYQRAASDQQDIFNLRANSKWGEWGLSSSIRVRLLAGEWENYQLSTRLNRQIKSLAMNIYAQGNSSALGLDRYQHRGILGLRWQQGLAGNSSYQWQVNQSPLYPDRHNHQLRMQLRLFQNPQWQIWTNAQSNLAGLGVASQTLWNQQILFNINRTFTPEWQWQNNIGYYLSIPFVPRDWPHTLQIQTGLNWVNALQQARITANYQYYYQGKGNHIWGLSANYIWRFGYETESQARLQGRVYHDMNGNGHYDEDETGLEQVQIQVDSQVITTNAQGQYELLGISQGGLKVSLQSSSLPPGYQVIGPATLEVQRNGDAPIFADFPVRRQIAVQGFAFSSPLLSQGLAQVQITLDGKQSVLTSSDGRYELVTTPGTHELRLNPMSIPPGYRLQGPLSRTFDSLTNQRIDFIFTPLIRLELQCLDAPKGKPVAGLKAHLVTGEAESEIETSDDQGIMVFDVPAGSVQIFFPDLKREVEITTADQPGVIKRQFFISPSGANTQP
jgi:hypothetical protein